MTELSSAELTGEWEYKLAQMEKGLLTRAEFMRHIEAMTRDIVERAKTYDSDTIPGDFGILQAACPKCGGLIRENYKKFQCSDCDYSLWKIVAGRQFEPHEIETLLTAGRVGPLIGFRNKMGRAFNAEIRLNDDKMPEFDFGQPREGEAAEAPDFSDQKPLGNCPKCGGGVFEHGTTFVCEKAVGPEKSCDFRSGKVILQQPIEPEQMEKLLSTGKTDLLRNFVSARTRRKFSAFLTWDAKAGKVGFEFEPRAPKATAAKKGSDDPAKDTAGEAKPAKAAATKKAATKPTRAKKAVVS